MSLSQNQNTPTSKVLAMNNLSSENTGTVRTGVNATALAVVGWVASNVFGFSLDLADPIVILVVAGAVPIFYRASRELGDRFPIIGRVLFGINTAPDYE